MEGRDKSWQDLPGDENEQKREHLSQEIQANYKSGDLLEWVKTKMNGWVVGEYENYTDEYATLSHNWGTIAKQLQVPTRTILCVRYICLMDPKKEFTLLKQVCECLHKLGHVVKHYKHYVPCPDCNKVMASKYVQQRLWGQGVFRDKCQKCSQAK